MVLGSTQPLTEMSTRNISLWGKGGRCVGLLPPSCADCSEIWKPQPPGSLEAYTGVDFFFYHLGVSEIFESSEEFYIIGKTGINPLVYLQSIHSVYYLFFSN